MGLVEQLILKVAFCELSGLVAMAGHAGHVGGFVVGGFTQSRASKRRLLGFFAEQRDVGCVGRPRKVLGVGGVAGRVDGVEHPRRSKNR